MDLSHSSKSTVHERSMVISDHPSKGEDALALCVLSPFGCHSPGNLLSLPPTPDFMYSPFQQRLIHFGADNGNDIDSSYTRNGINNVPITSTIKTIGGKKKKTSEVLREQGSALCAMAKKILDVADQTSRNEDSMGQVAILQKKVDDQDTVIAKLREENSELKRQVLVLQDLEEAGRQVDATADLVCINTPTPSKMRGALHDSNFWVRVMSSGAASELHLTPEAATPNRRGLLAVEPPNAASSPTPSLAITAGHETTRRLASANTATESMASLRPASARQESPSLASYQTKRTDASIPQRRSLGCLDANREQGIRSARGGRVALCAGGDRVGGTSCTAKKPSVSTLTGGRLQARKVAATRVGSAAQKQPRKKAHFDEDSRCPYSRTDTDLGSEMVGVIGVPLVRPRQGGKGTLAEPKDKDVKPKLADGRDSVAARVSDRRRTNSARAAAAAKSLDVSSRGSFFSH